MSILLDSASLDDAATAAGLGFVGGITTNPTLMRRETAEPLDRLGRLLAAFPVGPVFYQPAMGRFDDMLTEARMAAALAPERVVVKLPATGDAVRVGAALTRENIRNALTAVYAPAQALVAHEIGCAWAIPYVDRATRQGVNGLELVEQLAAVLHAVRSDTRILAASLKTPDQVAAAAARGAHDLTAPLDVLYALAEHPLSRAAIDQFSADGASTMSDSSADDLERYLREVTIGELEHPAIEVADYDPRWPRRFELEAGRIHAALDGRERVLEHIGSTAVPGLAAKPIVDILLVVDDPGDEASYVPALEAAGYLLRVREPDWHQHRMLRTPANDVHVHVFGPGSGEIERSLLLRDRLRADAADRQQYEQTKRRLAALDWPTMQHYAAAKSEVIETIIARARASSAE